MQTALIRIDDDDGSLMTAVRDGSRAALGELYRRHAGMVVRVAFGILGSRDEAEDVLHDVFVALPRDAHRYRHRAVFGGWLRTVVVRAALKRLRGPRGRHVRLEPSDVSFRPDPTDRIALQEALGALPAPLRVVFVLREIEGYSHREIGELVGISGAASRVRLHRAWSSLRKQVGE